MSLWPASGPTPAPAPQVKGLPPLCYAAQPTRMPGLNPPEAQVWWWHLVRFRLECATQG